MAFWILAVLILFVLIFIFRNFFKKLLGGKFFWIVFGLVLVCAATWSIFFHLPDGNLHLEVVRNGDESTFLIRDPHGKVLVFNPGRSVNELSAGVSQDLSPWDFGINEVWYTTRAPVRYLESLNERIPVTTTVLTPSVYLAGADQQQVKIPANIGVEKLSEGSQIKYASGLRVQLAGVSIESTALFAEFNQIRLLIPNGVDYALIHENAPETLENITILILQDEDISYIPPRVWQGLNPQVVLWNSTSLSPEPGWVGTDTHSKVELITDGVDWQIEVQ
jgi:hypothetical protein